MLQFGEKNLTDKNRLRADVLNELASSICMACMAVIALSRWNHQVANMLKQIFSNFLWSRLE